MQYLKDEELFGAIPQRDGGRLPGNAPNVGLDWVFNLKNEYRDAVYDCPAMPSEWKFHAKGKSQAEVNLRLEEMQERELDRIRTEYHKYVDAAIERFMERRNGFIYHFPSAETSMFKVGEDPKYFNYFKSRPSGFYPAKDSEMRRAQNALEHRTSGSVPLRMVCAVASAVLFLQTLLWQCLLDWIPALSTWRTDIDAANIGLVVIIALLEIVGCFMLFYALGIDDTDGGGKVGKWVLFAAILLVGGIAYSLPLEGAQDLWFCVAAKWIATVYFAVLAVVYWRSALNLQATQREEIRTIPQKQARYIEAFEQEFPKYYRYIRLRQLWYIYEYGEDAELPSWLSSLVRSAEGYEKLYFELKK